MDVLVVDDSRFMRGIIRVALAAEGLDVEEVDPSSLFDVLDHLHQAKPELLITDYEMPQCDGELLLTAVREDPDLAGLKIVVVSAHGEEELVARLQAYDLSGYLVKPLTPESVVAQVKPLLGT